MKLLEEQQHQDRWRLWPHGPSTDSTHSKSWLASPQKLEPEVRWTQGGRGFPHPHPLPPPASNHL